MDREELEEKYGRVWDTTELTRDFSVRGFMAPYVVAVHKESGKVGSLQFQHLPRFYFNWVEAGTYKPGHWVEDQ